MPNENQPPEIIGEPVIQSSTDQMMAKLFGRKIRGFNNFRRARRLGTMANIAYLCGNQNIKVLGGAIVPLEKELCTQVIWNKILPAVRNDIAVATNTSPKWDVVPSGTDEDDKATAKAGDKMLSYLTRINRFHEQRKSIVLWYDLDGIGWRKIYWNPFYKVIGNNPAPDEEGHNPELPVGEPIYQGEVVTEHLPNNELIYDWRQKNISRLKWCIHAKTITLAEAKERFGKDVRTRLPAGAIKEKLSDKDDFEVQILGKFKALSETLAPATADVKESELIEDDKLVNYYEFWHVITKTMPVGAYAVGLGDTDNLLIVENGPYPKEQYPHGELPIVGYDPLALDGISVGAVSQISQARPLQRHFNQMLSLIGDNIDAMGNSVIITTRDANIDFKKVTNFPGNIIEVDGPYTSGVKREPGVPIPGAFFAYLDTLAQGIDEIFAFHEPSKGIMPEGGPRSAIGLQTLQEADAKQLSPIVRSMDKSDERAAYQMLSLALANYNERNIQIIGKDNEWVLYKINPQELNGKISVIVRTGSSLPLSKTLMEQKAFMMWQAGLLGNPMDPSVRLEVLKIMDLGGIDQLLQSNAKHVNHSQKEFINAEKLVQQIPPIGPEVSADEVKALYSQYIFVPPPKSIDDHYTHIQEHTNFLLDKYYEYIGTGLPHFLILAQAMNDHVNLHQQIIYQQQIMQMALQSGELFKEKKETNKETK